LGPAGPVLEGYWGFGLTRRAAFKLDADACSDETSHGLTAQHAANRANVRVRSGGHLAGEELVNDVLHGRHHAAPGDTVRSQADKFSLSELRAALLQRRHGQAPLQRTGCAKIVAKPRRIFESEDPSLGLPYAPPFPDGATQEERESTKAVWAGER
jgi:hypothetical protein